MSNVLFVVGSLRKGSFNHQLAQLAEKALEGKATVTYLDYSKLPLMNQDLETPVLPEVAAVRAEIAKADAIWIFSPAYNFSIPGTIKNLLDWMSRALDLSDTTGESAVHNKLVTVSSVANAGFDNLFASYNFLLPFIRMNVVGDFTSTTVNPSAWADGQLVVADEVKASLEKQANQLLEAINA